MNVMVFVVFMDRTANKVERRNSLSNFSLFEKNFRFIQSLLLTHASITCSVSLNQDPAVLVIHCIPTVTLIPSINKLLELSLCEKQYFSL